MCDAEASAFESRCRLIVRKKDVSWCFLVHKLGSLSAFVLQVGSGTIASLANCIHRCKSPCVSVVVFLHLFLCAFLAFTMLTFYNALVRF